MIDEKIKTIGVIESAAVELKNLLDIAQTFTDGKSDNDDIKEIDFCLSKMEEQVHKLNSLFKNGNIEKLLNS
jgi:hypothetical protein